MDGMMMTSTTSKSEAPVLEHTSKCRVYVGNLDWEITWRDLKDHMRVIGHIRRADVMEDSNGRSRGFGIVEFNNEHDAMRAIAELNDTVLKSRRIFVREDRDLSKKAPLAKVHKVVEKKAPAGPREFDFSKVVIVSNLVPEIAWQDLKDQFRPAGAITRADIISGEDGVSTGVGIVEFRSANDVSNAVSLFNDSVFRENIVVVRPATAEDEFIKGKAPGHGRRVYVGQLAWSVAWQDLKDHCRPMGTVLRADVATDENRRSKGFGFVEFKLPCEAERAIRELNNSELHGRRIQVREDREER